MITIAIHGAEFFAYHGYYPEEQQSGGKFIVDVEVDFAPAGNINEDDINNTVNYESVYSIVATQMKHTRKLIETVGQAIADEIKDGFPFVDHIRVTVKKLNPPLHGKVGFSSVTITI